MQQKGILVLMWIILWAIVVHAIVNSDGICRGICWDCVYSGWCPQERR